jgi:hypothetical protein
MDPTVDPSGPSLFCCGHRVVQHPVSEHRPRNLIAARGDSKKGIVESLGAENAARLILETDLDGIDHAGGSGAKLRSAGDVDHCPDR